MQVPGGVPYYAGLAYRTLGLDSAVVTLLAETDMDFCLGDLRAAGMHVSVLPSPVTTAFENTYRGARSAGARTQRVSAVADPFSADDVVDIRGRYVHLGPLTSGDMPLSVFEAARRNFADVVLDVQGCLRRIEGGEVVRSAWADMAAGLACVNILKASRGEATFLTGCDDPAAASGALAAYGPREVIVTLGAEGSIVWCAGVVHRIPSVPARAAVDPTGCGDTYLAAYVALRRDGAAPEAAGAFASAAASLKLERGGALDVGRAAVWARLAEVGMGPSTFIKGHFIKGT